MKKLFLGLILTLNGIAFYSNYTLSGQTTAKTGQFEDRYTLSGVLFDSLVWETMRGRQCAELTAIQAVQIVNLNDLVNTQGKAIELLKTQTNALQGQIYVLEQTYDLNDQQHQAQNKYLKKSILKWKLIAVAEVVLLILVVL
jgi:hypothetical protein